MVNRIINKSKKFLVSPQNSVLSAASIIMLMIVASRVLGLVRQRTLAHFFEADQLSLFFAAFRLPDLIFEVLVFGTFSSAFIPVFTKTLKKGNSHAWVIAGTVVNIGLLVFIALAAFTGFAADEIYQIFAPGYSVLERAQIVKVARLLFFAQGFFVISYILTGVLESLRRFLVPALAPLFYNIGIIVFTVLFAKEWGLMAPAIGVFIGAMAHFVIQLPLAIKLGFRFTLNLRPNKEVKQIGKLALPRIIEVSFLQITKTVELFLSSLISTASYTYFTFGNSLQLLPVGLFGTSIAKAALPTLARQADNIKKFKKTLFGSLYQITFLAIPFSTILIVLRIPIVRLVYGTQIFSWESTVQTGYVLSAFAFGVMFQAANTLLARGFFALNDTKTPVIVSVINILIVITIDFILIRNLGVNVWGLAAAFSFGSFLQSFSLLYLLSRKINMRFNLKLITPIIKSAFSAFVSGVMMFFLLKFFDRSVWVKRLSFLGKIEGAKVIDFENFVLDTRYTANLLILTIFVSIAGMALYAGISAALRSEEIWVFYNLIRRLFLKRKVASIPSKEQEPISPTPIDTSGGQL